MKFGNEFPSGTDTQTTLASSWGLLVNIDSATGDIPVTTTWWIEDEKYGWWAWNFANNVSTSYSSTSPRTGRLILKTTFDVTWRARINLIPALNYSTSSTVLANAQRLIPCKPNTKYKITLPLRLVLSSGTWPTAQMEIVPLNSSWGLTWSAPIISTTSATFVNGVSEFTTSATAVWIGLLISTWWAGWAWYAEWDINSMTLEEVVEPVANSLTSASPSLVSFTAVGSTDNIDASSSVAGTWWINLGNGSTNIVSFPFLASKSKLTWVQIAKRANAWTFVWNVTVAIQADSWGFPTGTSLASYTIPNATWNGLAPSTLTTVNVPCNLTTGSKYHIVMTASTSDAVNYTRIETHTTTYISSSYQANYFTTAWNTSAWTYWRFVTLYYKPTTNFKASQNNSTVSISADEDGFLNTSIINLTTGAYSWWMWATPTDLSMGTNVFRSTAWPWTAVGSQTIIQNYWFYNYNSKNWIWTSATTSTLDLVWKCETILPITSDVVVSLTAITRTTWDVTVAFSTDDSAYTDLWSLGNSSNVQADFSYSTSALIWVTKFYIRVRRSWASSKFDISNLAISTTVNPTSLSTLRNYPTNKDIIKQYTKTLASPVTTTAIYRATKFWFPAIEYPVIPMKSGILAKYDMKWNVNDVSWNWYNWFLTWSPTLTTNQVTEANAAYSLNWTSQYITTPTIVSSNIPWYTICFWFNPVSKLTRSRPITLGNFCTAYYWNAWWSWTSMNWFVWNGAWYSWWNLAASFVTFGSWQFVAITYDKTTWRLYKNGVEFATQAYATATINLNWFFSYWGHLSEYCEWSFWWLSIYNRALTATEINDIYVASPEYQFLDVDTTATWSTVAFSETWASYTTVADGASIAISSTSTPSIWVKANITANRLYLSSNDYNANSGKDWSNKQSVVYQVLHLTKKTLNYRLGRASNLISYWN